LSSDDLHSSSLAEYPPVGIKDDALCYEDTDDSGNAQCTADCVAVTALNGSSFYPVVCPIRRPSLEIGNACADRSSVTE
jgi:hypothetical protein